MVKFSNGQKVKLWRWNSDRDPETLQDTQQYLGQQGVVVGKEENYVKERGKTIIIVHMDDGQNLGLDEDELIPV